MKPSPLRQAAAEFQDRVALVTGGTDGIGLDIALGLAAEGAIVYVCGRSREKGQSAERQAPERIRYIQTDLTDVTEWETILAQISEHMNHEH